MSKVFCRYLFVTSILFSFLSANLVLGEERWISGKHYTTLVPPVAVGTGQDLVVTEFFWYGCGHCFAFEPMLTAWGEKLPAGVALKPSPAVWNDPMRMHAKAFYVAQVLEQTDVLHQSIFNAMNLDRRRLVSRLAIRDLFEENGVDPRRFDKIFDSFGVDSQVRLADARAKSAKITGTPSMLVAGKYLIDTKSAGSQATMLEIASYLIEKELATRQLQEY